METSPTPLRILLVDDDEDDRELFCAALQIINPTAECRQAKDGGEALNMLKMPGNYLPNFIFLDLNMPRVDGFMCLKKIKEEMFLSEIPVVILTTSRHQEDKLKAARLGAIHYISKPDSFSALCDAIRFVLEKRYETA